MSEFFILDKKLVKIAIVGAAGSIGSTSAKIIAREGYKNIILVDIERKNPVLNELIDEIKKINPDVILETSHQLKAIKPADFIITATNAPEVVINVDDLKSGAVIIDDAQPSDVSPAVLDRADVLVVDAGVVHTPGIITHFDMGLNNKFNNFCCLGELLALSAVGWQNHYTIGRANLELVDRISEIANNLGFTLAKFQNKNGIISEEKLRNIAKIKNVNYSQWI